MRSLNFLFFLHIFILLFFIQILGLTYVHAGTGLQHPACGGRPTGERWLLRGYGWDESLIDGLRCYGGMYLYRLEGGWLHDRSNLVLICYNLRKKFEQTRNQICYMTDLIWYLSVTIISYLLETLTYLFYSNNIVANLY